MPVVDSAEPHPTDYVRFVVLGEPRTGSTMLAQALNSHGSIRCFREIFNWREEFVDYQMPGYDKSSKEDLAWRNRDPVGFLRERIFCQHPPEVRAVGFKFLYPHFWGFPGLVPHLAADTDLHVLHITRRNLLRQLVSWKIAEITGLWAQGSEPNGITLADVLRMPRRPLRALADLRSRLRRKLHSREARRVRVTISPEELSKYLEETHLSASHFGKLFQEHPALAVVYEDMVDRREEVFRRAQDFLGVGPTTLTVSLRKQNPQPLRELIQNYDELHNAFQNTRYAEFFE